MGTDLQSLPNPCSPYIPVFRLTATYLLVGLLDFSLTLKMEALCSSEKSVATQRTTWRHIPEDDTLHNHRCENLKLYSLTVCLYVYPLIIPRQRLSRNITTVTNTHATIEEVLDTSFSMWPMSYQGK
jgi:hypothetical protein